MTQRTLITIFAAPLFFAFLALVVLARLDGQLVAYERSHEQTTQARAAAINAIESGQLRPSPEQLSALLRAGAKATESERKLVASLWSVVKIGSCLVVFGSLAHAFFCIAAFRNARRTGSANNAL